MTHPIRILPVLVLFVFGLNVSVVGQVRPFWFDINPNQSNTDPSNPNGASGGRVNHVGAASDLSKIYAASEFGGLYQSFDQGNTWVKVNSFAPSATWDVKVDPRNSKQVYATSFFDGRVNPQSGISVSNNAGNSWTPVNIATLNTLTCTNGQRIAQPSGWQIAIDPTNTANVFVGTSCGLARLINGTWDFVDPSPGNNAEQIYAVVASGNGVVNVIGDNGFFRSTNNGNAGTWSAALAIGTQGPTSGNSGPTSSLAASPAENYVLFAINLGGPPTVNNIFESDNGGTTWPTSLTPPANNAQGRVPFIRTNQLSTSNQFDLWVGDVNLFRETATTPVPSSQGGPARAPLNAWGNVQTGGHADNGDLMFDPRFTAGACPKLFTSDGGIYRNLEINNPRCQAPTWEQPIITPHATWVWGFDGMQLGAGQHAITYGLQDAGAFAATNVAESYNPPPANWNNYVCCDVSDNSQGPGRILSLEGFFGPPRSFRLFRRNQDGSAASEIPNYPSTGTISGFDSGKGNARFGPSAYALNLSDGVYFTNDVGGNPIAWTTLNKPTAVNSGSGSIKIANLQGRPNVYYFTSNGNPANQGVIFRSTLVANTGAAGANWTSLPLPAGIGTVTVYDVDPNNGNRIIIAGINNATQNFEIWMTENFGAAGSWVRLQQLENAMVGAGAAGNTFLNRSSQGLTTGGGFTFNFGTSWQPTMLQFNPINATTIAAGAVDSGVFISLDNGTNWQLLTNPINPDSTTPHIPRPLFAYFSPGRFNASTNSFDMWVGTRGAGVWKVVLDQVPVR
jgi:hypothetical protein